MSSLLQAECLGRILWSPRPLGELQKVGDCAEWWRLRDWNINDCCKGFSSWNLQKRMLRWRLCIYSRMGPRNLSLNNHLNTTNHFNKRSPGDTAAQPSICWALGQPPGCAEFPCDFPKPALQNPKCHSCLTCLLFPLSTRYISQEAEGSEGALMPAATATRSKKEMISPWLGRSGC